MKRKEEGNEGGKKMKELGLLSHLTWGLDAPEVSKWRGGDPVAHLGF